MILGLLAFNACRKNEFEDLELKYNDSEINGYTIPLVLDGTELVVTESYNISLLPSSIYVFREGFDYHVVAYVNGLERTKLAIGYFDFVDNSIVQGGTYKYEFSIRYTDGVESVKMMPITITVP